MINYSAHKKECHEENENENHVKTDDYYYLVRIYDSFLKMMKIRCQDGSALNDVFLMRSIIIAKKILLKEQFK